MKLLDLQKIDVILLVIAFIGFADNWDQFIWDHSFETTSIETTTFETIWFETTFTWDFFIWDHINLRPHLCETTFLWDHIHLSSYSFETAFIFGHVYSTPRQSEAVLIYCITFLWSTFHFFAGDLKFCKVTLHSKFCKVAPLQNDVNSDE